MAISQMQGLIIARDNPTSITHAARTTIATLISLWVAHLFHLPEFYWAGISTLIVMQSTLGAALPISAQRFTGTAIGAAAGALVGSYFPGSVVFFGLTLFVIGLFSALLHLERGAYRYAGIALAIVMLIPRSAGIRTAALHRFLEVSIGIMVGLVITAVWPENVGLAIWRRSRPGPG